MNLIQLTKAEEDLLQELSKQISQKTGLIILSKQEITAEKGKLVPFQLKVSGNKKDPALYLVWTEIAEPDSMTLRLLEVLALEIYKDLISQTDENPAQELCTWERLMEKGLKEQWDKAEFQRQAALYPLSSLKAGFPVYVQCTSWHPKIPQVLSNLYPQAQVNWCYEQALFLWIPIQAISLSEHRMEAQGEEIIQEVYSLLADELGVSAAVLIGEPNQDNLWEGYLEVKALAELHARFFAGDPGLTSWKTGFSALYSTLQSSTAEQYIEKMLGVLSEELLETLLEFLEHDLSISDTAKALFIHRNTLTYRIDRITELTGHNPRKLTEAVYFFLAIWLKKHMRY